MIDVVSYAKSLGFTPIEECEDYKEIKRMEMEANEFIQLLHNNNDGYISFGIMNHSKWENIYSTPKTSEKIITNIIDNPNNSIYVSMNGFFTKKREESCLRHINALWVDLDYYKITEYKNKAFDEMLEILKEADVYEDLPPSLVVNSGNGMYLVWLINSLPKQVKPLWDATMYELNKRFLKYGADFKAKDVSRVLRIPGSINQKTKNKCNIYKVHKQTTLRYELRDISSKLLKYSKEEVEEFKRKKKNTKITKPKKVTKNNNKIRSFKILEDIEKLVELRNGNIEGLREIICFIYRNFAKKIYSYSEIEDMLINLNYKFSNPLSYNELINSTNNFKLYKYKTKTLIELLEVTENEFQFMKELCPKEKKQENIKYRNEWVKQYRKKKRREEFNGLTKREYGKVQKIKAIKKLLNKGFKQIDIAKKLKVSQSLVSKYVKEINECLNKDNNTEKHVCIKIVKKLNSLKMFLEKHLLGFICCAIKNKDIKFTFNATFIDFYFHNYSYLLMSNEFT